MILTQRNPAVFRHDGARKCDLTRQLITSENRPSRADPQDICSSDRLASSVASGVAPPDFALQARHDDAAGPASPAFDRGASDAKTAASTTWDDDLVAEFLRCDPLSVEVRAALCRAGVDLDAICRRRVEQIAWTDPPRQDYVVCLGENRFEFARYRPTARNSLALIFTVRNHLGDLIDLVACTGSARRPALWCARGCLLGEESLFSPRIREGLPVHPTPMEWLRASCRGVVILDAEKSKHLLYRAQPLEAATTNHGRELRAIMEVKPPRILVPAPTNRRAA